MFSRVRNTLLWYMYVECYDMLFSYSLIICVCIQSMNRMLHYLSNLPHTFNASMIAMIAMIASIAQCCMIDMIDTPHALLDVIDRPLDTIDITFVNAATQEGECQGKHTPQGYQLSQYFQIPFS
jgi:hypothetical protein